VRIAQVIGSMLAPLGGAEQYVVELSRAQVAAGHEVVIVTGWISPEVVAALAADGVAVEVVRSRRPHAPDVRGSRPGALMFHGLDLLDSIRTPRALRRALGSGWDAVHVHRIAGLGAGMLRTTPAPVVITVHDYSLVDTRSNLLRGGVIAARPPLLQRLRTRVISRAAAEALMVFPSAQVLERHRAWGLRVPAASVVVPHGWRIGPSSRNEPAPSPLVFLFVGKLLPTKGVELLLQAWGAGLPGAELWIAGSGPLDGEVARAAAAGRVRHLGWLDAPARDAALATASVLVLPSMGPEIFLLAAAEGALAGLPVISTTVAAPPSVRDGESGILVEADAGALRAGMERLLDPAERSRLAVGARRAAADLDFGTHLGRVLALYSRAASLELEGAR
jgi:glycosyltransferase involved in cell wall biosynthesis